MAQSQRNLLGKKLLENAVSGYYAFQNEELELALDKALLQFEGQEDWYKKLRAHLWAISKIRNAICDEAMKVYG
jgi:hypothetical protein